MAAIVTAASAPHRPAAMNPDSRVHFTKEPRMTRCLSIALALLAAFGMSVTAQDCPAKQGCDEGGKSCCPSELTKNAQDLAAAWKALPARLEALPEADSKELIFARAKLQATCPACQNFAPTFAFLKASFAAQAAFDQKAMECCKDGQTCPECEKFPKEAREAFARRAEATKAGLVLLTAMCDAAATQKKDGACGDGGCGKENQAAQQAKQAGGCCKDKAAAQQAKKDEGCCVGGAGCGMDACESSGDFAALAVKAEAVAKTWSETIPAAWEQTSADEAAARTQALATLSAKHPGVPVKMASLRMIEAITALQVAADETCASNCPSKCDPEVFANNPAMKAMADQFAARAALAAKTHAVARSMNAFMGKVMPKSCGKSCPSAEPTQNN